MTQRRSTRRAGRAQRSGHGGLGGVGAGARGGASGAEEGLWGQRGQEGARQRAPGHRCGSRWAAASGLCPPAAGSPRWLPPGPCCPVRPTAGSGLSRRDSPSGAPRASCQRPPPCPGSVGCVRVPGQVTGNALRALSRRNLLRSFVHHEIRLLRESGGPQGPGSRHTRGLDVRLPCAVATALTAVSRPSTRRNFPSSARSRHSPRQTEAPGRPTTAKGPANSSPNASGSYRGPGLINEIKFAKVGAHWNSIST